MATILPFPRKRAKRKRPTWTAENRTRELVARLKSPEWLAHRARISTQIGRFDMSVKIVLDAKPVSR